MGEMELITFVSGKKNNLMTPFGFKLRSLRKEKNVTTTELAKALKVSTAYLSMLENGKRGNPPDGMLELICIFFDLTWDDAEELKDLAKISDINVQINTKFLGIDATTLTNVLKNNIRWLTNKQLIELSDVILSMVKKNQN